jgi:hypothetical protein
MWACQTYAGTFGTKKHFLAEEAMRNRRRVAEILLQAGADVNIEANVSGQKCFDKRYSRSSLIQIPLD